MRSVLRLLAGTMPVAWLLATTVVVGAASDVSPVPTLPTVPDGPWTVTEVVDGDTIHVATDGITDTVRLVGINAPEHGECWSDEATDALRGFLGSGPVGLERDVTDRDQYGRLLRYVATPSG